MYTMKGIKKQAQKKGSTEAIRDIYAKRAKEQEENDAYRKLYNLGPCDNIEMHKMMTGFKKLED
jgi:hypothetical protein